MESVKIQELLRPYLGDEELSFEQTEQVSTYLDLLVKWNARINLTAVRDPEQMVQRHFGESLFAARQLVQRGTSLIVADVGSGAGFPGVPLKIYAPELQLTLIEAQGKKATFLREVVRATGLTHINIFAGRAEQWEHTADLVTLRAVEKFEVILPLAARLVAPGGRLAVLIGVGQERRAEELAPGGWGLPIGIPGSRERVVKVRQFA